MFLFDKNFVFKHYKTKFLSCNLKFCAVLRRIPSVVDVKAKIKPITYVYVRKKFRCKTLQNEVNNLGTWKVVLYYVEQHQWLTLRQKSNRKLMFLFETIFVQNEVNNHATWKVVLYYFEHHQWLTLKQKSNQKLMFLFEKNFVSKFFKT